MGVVVVRTVVVVGWTEVVGTAVVVTVVDGVVETRSNEKNYINAI